MTPWERTLFKLFLRTTSHETELPLAKLQRELENEAPHIRAYWGQQNRILFTHLMIASMRDRICPAAFISGRWHALIDYLNPHWRLCVPGAAKSQPVLEALLEFKRAYDCEVHRH
jgi:hypothetical protein